MKDVVRSASTRGANSENKTKSKHEQGSIVGYCAIAFVFVSLIVLVLCLTVFFKVKLVEINGVTLYRDDQILGVGGILKDENLVRTDTSLIKKRLEENLVFIEEAKVEKKYPSTLIISVTEAEKAADIVMDDKVCVVSKSGRVLEMGNTKTTGGIPVVRGFELTSKKVGEKLASKDESKLKIYKDLLKIIDSIGMDKITEIDLNSRSGIILLYDGRITLELGSSMDLDYKLNYFKSVIDSKLSDDFKGKLVYNGADSGISAIPDGAGKKDEAKDDSSAADKDKDKDKQDAQNGEGTGDDQNTDANTNANTDANANANTDANADLGGNTNYGYMQQDQNGTQGYGYMQQQDQNGTGYDYNNGGTGYDYGYNNGTTGYDYGYGYNNGTTGYDYGYGYNNGTTGYDYGYVYNNGTTGYDYGYGFNNGTTGYDYGYGYNNGATGYDYGGSYDYNAGGYGY